MSINRTAAGTLLLVWILVAGAAPEVSPEENRQILAQREAVKAEYALAREPHFYFFVDIGAKKMELKVKGMVLKSWPIFGMRYWGRPDFTATIELVRKSALKTPERFVIIPAGQDQAVTENPAEFELNALEVSDMPENFTLYFGEGLTVSVRTKARGLTSRLGSLINSVKWYGLVPISNLVGTVRGKPKSILELTFEQEEQAQSIYWIFFEGIKGQIYLPPPG